MELFRRFRKIFQTRSKKKSEQIAESKEELEHMEKVVTDLDAFNNLMIEKIEKEKEKKAILLHTVQKLEATLASERKQQEQDINERNSTHLQNFTELQSSLKLYEKQEKTVERERDSWVREQKQLLERVAQLEASLEFERNKWKEKSKKDQLDMRERNNLHLQTISELQDTLNLCKEERKTAKLEKDHLIRHQERLEERVAQLQATLDFEKNKWQVKVKMVKQDLQERTILHLQTIRDLQDSLNQCEEEKNCAEHERDNLMREREQQKEHVAQLKATLEFERNKWKEKRKKSKLDMEKNNNLQLQTIRELQDSLNHCEEEKNRAEHERDHLMRYQEQLEDHVVQLTLNLKKIKWDEEKKKATLDMVGSSNMFLSSIRELQDTVNHCKIQKKTKELEKDHSEKPSAIGET